MIFALRAHTPEQSSVSIRTFFCTSKASKLKHAIAWRRRYSRSVRTRPRATLSIRRSFFKKKMCTQFTCFTGTSVQILTRRTYIRSTALLTCYLRRISKCLRPTSLRSLAWYSLYLRYWYTSTCFTGTKGAIRVAFQIAHFLQLAALAGMVLTLLVLLVQKYKH